MIVSYDSVPRQVMDTLLQIAAAHPLVLKNPEPQAVFTAFGDAIMTFELRVYLADIVNGNGVRNDLRLAIYERFKDEGLGAPFPKEELEPEPLPPGPEADALALQAETAGPPVPAEGTPLPAEAFKRSGTQRRPRRVSVDGAGDRD